MREMVRLELNRAERTTDPHGRSVNGNGAVIDLVQQTVSS
jgi:hypothetical protein